MPVIDCLNWVIEQIIQEYDLRSPLLDSLRLDPAHHNLQGPLASQLVLCISEALTPLVTALVIGAEYVHNIDRSRDEKEEFKLDQILEEPDFSNALRQADHLLAVYLREIDLYNERRHQRAEEHERSGEWPHLEWPRTD